MGLVTLVRSRLSSSKEHFEESRIQKLRKEITKLKAENRALKEEVIVFPQRNNEEIPIMFIDEKIEDVIIKNIHEVKRELCIAAAWLTSNALIEELSSIKKRGVDIKVIISNAQKDKKIIYKLKGICNRLKIAIIPNLRNEDFNSLMHNKYCIIDNKIVIDESYNLSNSAKYNLEHIMIIESKAIAKMYKESFDKIYNNNEYYSYSDISCELG